MNPLNQLPTKLLNNLLRMGEPDEQDGRLRETKHLEKTTPLVAKHNKPKADGFGVHVPADTNGEVTDNGRELATLAVNTNW